MNSKRNITIAVKVRPEVREWLLEEAQQQYRTLSAEVCMRLESAYERAIGSKTNAGAEVAPNV
ncbi:hypothetical protein [Burkholderia gladioli]|uniref:hypothetical protein n=1 Tax=Burkholderia gladioli TaxID=28095 RepID=UPI002FDFEED5